MPKMHRASRRRLGVDPNRLLASTWWYRDGYVQEGNDTLQVFRADYPHGPHSLLSPWHLVGRFQAPKLTPRQRLNGWFDAEAQRRRVETKHKRPEVAAVMGLPGDERVRALRGAWAAEQGRGFACEIWCCEA